MGLRRRQAVALWLAGVSGVGVQMLWLASHGPTEVDERNVVLGLTHHDFERWSVFGLLLAVYGLVGLHQYQRSGYGRFGAVGFRVTITGFALVLAGTVWDYVLFDPWEHPLHGIGFLASLVGLFVIVVGWVVWGVASAQSRSLPSWALPVPFFIAVGWIAALVFGDALYELVSIDNSVAFQIVGTIGFLVFGAVLWTSREADPTRT